MKPVKISKNVVKNLWKFFADSKFSTNFDFCWSTFCIFCWFVEFGWFQQMLICWFIFVEFVDLLKFVEKSTKIKNQQAILKTDQQKQKSTNDFYGFLEPCSYVFG